MSSSNSITYDEAIQDLRILVDFEIDRGPRGDSHRAAIEKAIEAMEFCSRAGVIFRDLKPNYDEVIK